MKLTYYGHSCFGLEIEGTNILFDPFVTPNELASHIDVDSIPADIILISHGHEDHVADVERIANRTGALLVSNYEIISWYAKNGLTNGHGMNIGGWKSFDFGRVKYVNAVHSSMLPDGSYGGNPGGWMIESGPKCVYYAGDTALHQDMKLIAMHQPTLGILPIGDCFTMGIEDAVNCSDFIKCNEIVGMHYDTFPPIKIDHEQARLEFERMGKRLTLMEIGSSLEF